MKTKKKILLVAASDMSLTGVPVVYMSIVRLLNDEFDFDIVVLDTKNMYFKNEFLSYGGQIFKFECPKPNGTFKSLLWALFSFKKKAKHFIKKNLNLNNYSCIHTFNGEFGSVLFNIAKKNSAIKKYFHICSAQSAYKRKRKTKERMWDLIFSGSSKYSDKIIFASKSSLENSKYKRKGVVLYSVYDEEKFGQIIECNHNSLSLTQIGTLSSRKNQLFSIKVLKRLKDLYPDILLRIVGREAEDGYLKKITNYTIQNNLSNNVAILNPATDKIKLSRETSYIIMPSTMESFGLVLIESQSCGIHCFASDRIPNDADMGNVEFLPLDENIWARKISDFFKENGNKRLRPINVDKFSSGAFVNTLKKLYEDIN